MRTGNKDFVRDNSAISRAPQAKFWRCPCMILDVLTLLQHTNPFKKWKDPYFQIRGKNILIVL
jgi:hypothetical protein